MKMKTEYQEIVARMMSPFGESGCLDQWIGKGKEKEARDLCKRVNGLTSPSKKARREGAIPVELSEIDLTESEISLVELVIEKGIYKAAMARAAFSKSIA